MHVTYRCVGHGDPNLLYTNETRGATFEANVAAEAALGSVVHLECATPDPVLLPGGSLFADPQALGGSLRFKGPSHSGAFAYEKAGELRYVYTFRYWTDRSFALPPSRILIMAPLRSTPSRHVVGTETPAMPPPSTVVFGATTTASSYLVSQCG